MGPRISTQFASSYFFADHFSVSNPHFAISRRELGFLILEVFIETRKAVDRGWRADLYPEVIPFDNLK
jgi:hypothetical protein